MGLKFDFPGNEKGKVKGHFKKKGGETPLC